MPQVELSKVLKPGIELQSVQGFAKQLSISSTAVYNAVRSDLIDYCMIETKTFIVMSKITKAYKPNNSPLRKKVKKRKTKPNKKKR